MCIRLCACMLLLGSMILLYAAEHICLFITSDVTVEAEKKFLVQLCQLPRCMETRKVVKACRKTSNTCSKENNFIRTLCFSFAQAKTRRLSRDEPDEGHRPERVAQIHLLFSLLPVLQEFLHTLRDVTVSSICGITVTIWMSSRTYDGLKRSSGQKVNFLQRHITL